MVMGPFDSGDIGRTDREGNKVVGDSKCMCSAPRYDGDDGWCYECPIHGYDPQRCEDCGGRFILGSHYCFGSPVTPGTTRTPEGQE